VRELTLLKTESGNKILTEERSLGNNFEKSLIDNLLVSGLGFRESSLLGLTFEESLISLGRLLEVGIVDLLINLFFLNMLV
jgi:hypothetical protein